MRIFSVAYPQARLTGRNNGLSFPFDIVPKHIALVRIIMKHLLSIESLDSAWITEVISLGRVLKTERAQGVRRNVLEGQCWAMIFAKSSTRTRVTFEVGIRELGGSPMFFAANDLQLGRGEPVKDTARVLGRVVSGAVIRTFAQADVAEFAEYSGVPTINALTDEEHPCQILADIQTYEERRGPIAGCKVCFLGDGDCNVARSWMWAAARLGFRLVVGAPKKFQPPEAFVARINAAKPDAVSVIENPEEAVADADLLYTDVWVSMGREGEATERLRVLAPYQLNGKLIARAKADALVMHCLPAYREKEITAELFETHAETIFDQAENRLHIQKAILSMLTQA